jgi:hypothetical protein
MRKISRENTLVRKFSLAVISTVEKNARFLNDIKTKYKHLIGFAELASQSRNEFNYTRRRETFRRETLQNHVAHGTKTWT